MPSLSLEPALPVSAWATAERWLVRAEHTVADATDSDLAALVHLRLRLERLHAWWLLGGIGAALLSVIAVGAVVDSRSAFGAYAAAVASGTVWLGVLANWAQQAVFRRHALAAGLSTDAANRLFRAAQDADHWIGVLNGCGHTPSHAELASFVRAVDEANTQR